MCFIGEGEGALKTMKYRRLDIDFVSTDPFTGLYLAAFGSHGPEVLELRREADPVDVCLLLISFVCLAVCVCIFVCLSIHPCLFQCLSLLLQSVMLSPWPSLNCDSPAVCSLDECRCQLLLLLSWHYSSIN